MSFLCPCLRDEGPPTPLDADIKMPGNCAAGLVEGEPQTRRRLGFPLYGALCPNFDFLTHDNGETYIATFRAMYRGEVMGFDSNPIPKDVFKDFRVISKKKKGDVYSILLDIGGHTLIPYISKMTQEDFEKLGLENIDTGI